MEVPEAHGQVEIGQDVLHGLAVERPDRGQGLAHHVHLDPARARAARPGRRVRGQLVAHLGLGQQPQEGFRALAVHELSVRHVGNAANRVDHPPELTLGKAQAEVATARGWVGLTDSADVQQRTMSRMESKPATSWPSTTTRCLNPPRTIASAASSRVHSGEA